MKILSHNKKKAVSSAALLHWLILVWGLLDITAPSDEASKEPHRNQESLTEPLQASRVLPHKAVEGSI